MSRSEDEHRRTFHEVREHETSVIAGQEGRRTANPWGIGLAFSGGGIRSASLAIGFLQGLAREGALERFDYVSGVSGGAYTVAWLSAWLRNVTAAMRDTDPRDAPLRAVQQVSKALLETPSPDGRTEAPPVAHVRNHARYLAPDPRVFGGDLWALLSAYLIASVLNVMVLVTAIATVFGSPYVVYALLQTMTDKSRLNAAGYTLGLFFICLLAEVSVIIRPKSKSLIPSQIARFFQVATFYTFSLFSTMVLLSYPGYYSYASRDNIGKVLRKAELSQYAIVALLLVAILAIIVIERLSSRVRKWMPRKLSRLIPLVTLLFILVTLIVPWTLRLIAIKISWFGSDRIAGALFLGPVAGFVWLTILIVILLATIGKGFPENVQSWLTELVGRWLLVAGVGVAVTFISIASPRLLALYYSPLFGAGIILAGVAGHIGLRLRLHSGKFRFVRGIIRLIYSTSITSAVILLLAGAVHLIVAQITRSRSESVTNSYWELLQYDIAPRYSQLLPWLLGLCVLLMFLTGNNRLTMNTFYKRCLARCFVNASNSESGSNGDGDLALRDIGVIRPFPLINCTLNLSHGSHLGWRDRKACSFVFSPLYVGFSPPAPAVPGYVPVDRDDYKLFSLARAVAISGAAVSPFMGFRSWWPVGFALTALSFRLGWWVPNPSLPSWSVGRRGPVTTWIRELTGFVRETSGQVYLSDGGHFENLGVYELVRRRCRVMVCLDGGADGSHQFRSLGNLIEKVRVDFGVEIAVRDSPRSPAAADGPVVRQLTVRYPEEADEGILIYVKPSVFKGLPLDVQIYAESHSEFPHESTANQFFGERQFECYRALGERLGCATAKQLPS